MVNILPQYIPRKWEAPVGGWVKGPEEKAHVRSGFIKCAWRKVQCPLQVYSRKSTLLANLFQCGWIVAGKCKGSYTLMALIKTAWWWSHMMVVQFTDLKAVCDAVVSYSYASSVCIRGPGSCSRHCGKGRVTRGDAQSLVRRENRTSERQVGHH